MKTRALFLIFILSTFSVQALDNQLLWGQIIQVDEILKEKNELIVNAPVGGYRKLIQWKEGPLFKCLIYKVGTKNDGELFTLNSKEEGCLLKNLDQRKIWMNKVKKLKVVRNLNKDGHNFTFFKDDNRGKKINFPFGSFEHSRWAGIRPLKEDDGIKNIKLKDGELCRYWDFKLKQISTEVNCDMCSSKLWTPIINFMAADQVLGICGVNNCGAKGQYPCLKLSSLRPVVSCEEVKDFVYCQTNKSVICRDSGELECR